MSKVSHFVFSAVLAMSAFLPVSSNAETTNDAAGPVFIMTNAAGKNEIISYKRSADGSLEQGRSEQSDYPAFRSLFFGVSGKGSSSHSNDSARDVVSMGSSSGMSSATAAPNSANFRAETSTRFSSEPTAWL
jgi:hypothetical protein